MQLPIKAHYATLAMLAIAQRFEMREPLAARVIAADQKIPSQFLGQILQQLRAAGLITSTRGACGGFHLVKPPDQISIGEVVDAVCISASGASAAEEASPLSEVVQEVWDALRSQQRQFLEQLTLGELLQRSLAPNSMFYI